MSIQEGIRTPGMYTDVNINTQRTGLPANTQKVLFITPDHGPEMLVSIYDKGDATTHFGANSIAARMIVAAVKTNRTVDVQCIGETITTPSEPWDIEYVMDGEVIRVETGETVPANFSSEHNLKNATDLTIRDTVKHIGTFALEELFGAVLSGVKDVVIPDSVLTIGEYGFRGCGGVKSFTIGAAVQSIGDIAFAYNRNLQSITCKAKQPPVLGQDALMDLPADTKIYVPAPAVNEYKNAPGWSAYSSQIFGIQ